MIGILEHIDGRKLKVGDATVYLRKGVDSAQYLSLLQSSVEVATVSEKGFDMVEVIRPASEAKPSLPKTAVEDTKPVDMPSSSNVPKLQFGKQENFTSVATPEHKLTQKSDNRTQKDWDIMRQWAMGATLNSPALTQANDALALSTQQTIERAKRVAEELLKWVVER